MDCPNVTYLELAMFQSSRERESMHSSHLLVHSSKATNNLQQKLQLGIRLTLSN